jgi:predicted TIM-barrel fold metal-dependent hydrolase
MIAAMLTRRALAVLLGVVFLIGGASLAVAQRPGAGGGPRPFGGPRGMGGPPAVLTFQWIDVHAHFVGDRGDYRGAVLAAIAAMDEAGIARMVVMPPPHVSGGHVWDIEDILPALAPRARFGFLGGGGTLNPMIQDTKSDAVDAGVQRRFEARAEAIIKQGAAGFGEITAHHLSHAQGHPYESVDADHPLLRLLADVAARHAAVIDLHFDVVAEDMNAPEWLASPPNPSSFRANVAGFERLLEHNRGARIVWAHLGSDQLGWWTVDLSRRLLAKHPNLFMSLRLAPGRVPQNHPLLPGGALRPEWLDLFREFSDRFVIGADTFIVSPSVRGGGPGVIFAQRAPMIRQRTRAFLAALPADLARKIGAENARRLYKLE